MSKAKEIRPIILTDTETGEEYTLEFNREAIRFAEQRGFDVTDVERHPMTRVPELFFYAFRMHHKNVSREKTDRILFDMLGGLSPEAMERLGELYSVPFMELTPSEDEPSKNPRMTVTL